MARKKKGGPDERFTVWRDSGEHEGHGWVFSPSERCAGTVVRNLYTADYSLEGFYDEKLLVIERKGCVAELAGNLTNPEKWDDFRQVLERMEEFRHPFLVLEFTMATLRSFPVGSGIPKHLWPKLRVSGPYLMKLLAKIELKYRTRVAFAGPCGKDYALGLFKRLTEKD